MHSLADASEELKAPNSSIFPPAMSRSRTLPSRAASHFKSVVNIANPSGKYSRSVWITARNRRVATRISCTDSASPDASTRDSVASKSDSPSRTSVAAAWAVVIRALICTAHPAKNPCLETERHALLLDVIRAERGWRLAKVLSIGVAAMILMSSLSGAHAPVVQETKAQKDARMGWWRDARFGMFIHWGLYSVPAGEWDGKKNYGEWIMEEAHIPVDTYEKFLPQFNPVKFNADDWARMAKDAGMQYVVITTKHHEGFALYDSKTSPYSVMATPFKRDVMKELSTAVRGQGLQMCWYHSIMDWHSPLYLPARPWNPRAGGEKNLDAFNQYLRSMVSELLTNYGPIGVMWFDGEWESTWGDKYGKPLYELCRQLQPNVIVNNRVSNGRSGSMEDASAAEVGDFSTPEQYIPATGIPGVDWETCMTMNGHWGYNKNDTEWKSSAKLITNLVDIVSKGGNYLLNIGPKSDGTFPQEAVERLHDIGQWMHVNGDSIHGTTASVFENLPWGRSTTKRHGDSTTLYLQVLDWPKNGKLVVPGIGNDAMKAELMDGKPVDVVREGGSLVLGVPATAPDSVCSVVKLEVAGTPIIYKAPKIVAPTDILVGPMKVSIDSGSKEMAVRYTLDGSDPTEASAQYAEPVTIQGTSTLKAAAFHHGKLVSSVSSMAFKQVTPKPAADARPAKIGIECKQFKGDWDVCPDFDAMTPESEFTAKDFDCPMVDGSPREHVGRQYDAYLDVPQDGVYIIGLTSDDGSKLWIDGEVAIDNDGAHSSQTKTAGIALAKGPHRVKVAWFNKTGGAELKLTWALAGEKQTPVPPSAWRCN